MKLPNFRVLFFTVLLLNSLFVPVLSVFFLLPLIIPAIRLALTVYEVYNVVDSLIGEGSSQEASELALQAAADAEEILRLEEELNELQEDVMETKNLLIKHIWLKPTMEKVQKYQYRIRSRHKQMLYYKEFQNTLENSTLLDFAKVSALPNGDSMHFLLDMYHLSLLGAKSNERFRENIFTKLARSHKDFYGDVRTSKYMYTFYTDIVNTQLKGYSVLEFSWLILKGFKKGKYTLEKQFAHEEFRERLERTERMFRKAITWKCEPPKNARGKKRTEFQKLLEGFEKDEVIMFSEGSCMNGCKDIENSNALDGAASEYCNRENECEDRLYECDYSGREAMVCLSPGKGSRSVNLVEYEDDGEIVDNNTTCPRTT